MQKKLKDLVLKYSYLSQIGQVGCSLSVVDLIWCLYDSVLNVKSDDFINNNNERDRFIESKGHAGLALFIVLHLKGFISEEQLSTYCKNDSLLTVHPKHYMNGVEFSSGSLGQGITFATGCALAAKMQKSNRKVYCLISDGEINEGSCWESFLFANHHKLNNLIIIYDNNGQQGLDFTENVLINDNVNEKMKSFGFEVHDINGHNHDVIKNTFEEIFEKINANIIQKPIFINAHTILGNGVSYMEKSVSWHYKIISEKQYDDYLLDN